MSSARSAARVITALLADDSRGAGIATAHVEPSPSPKAGRRLPLSRDDMETVGFLMARTKRRLPLAPALGRNQYLSKPN